MYLSVFSARSAVPRAIATLHLARLHVRHDRSSNVRNIKMVQALTVSTSTALVAARAGQTRVNRAKAVVARCVKNHCNHSACERYDPFLSLRARATPSHRNRVTLPCSLPLAVVDALRFVPSLHVPKNSAKPVVKATKRVTKALPVGLAAAAPLFASMPAHAQNAVFTVADLADGNVDEETALYVLVGGCLAIVTAVLSLVIGSEQFVKNFSRK